MPVIPSGNITLLELIDLAFEQKHGNATVDPPGVDEALEISHQWQAVRDAVWKAFKAHDLTLYVESLDGTEKRLTDQDEWQSDKWPVGRTLLTGKLEHELDPAYFQRTVYVRDDDASTFLKKFTGKGFDRPIRQPDTATGGADQGKAAELSEPTDPVPSAVRPNRRGRKKGSGGYDTKDLPLIEEMHRLITSEEPMGRYHAMLKVVDRAEGETSAINRGKRLLKKYATKYDPDEGHSA